MTWQDLTLSGGSILLALALLPMLFGEHKPAPSSAALTASVLWTFAAVYITLHLHFAAATTAATAAEWTILLFQSWRLK